MSRRDFWGSDQRGKTWADSGGVPSWFTQELDVDADGGQWRGGLVSLNLTACDAGTARLAESWLGKRKQPSAGAFQSDRMEAGGAAPVTQLCNFEEGVKRIRLVTHSKLTPLPFSLSFERSSSQVVIETCASKNSSYGFRTSRKISSECHFSCPYSAPMWWAIYSILS